MNLPVPAAPVPSEQLCSQGTAYVAGPEYPWDPGGTAPYGETVDIGTTAWVLNACGGTNAAYQFEPEALENKGCGSLPTGEASDAQGEWLQRKWWWNTCIETPKRESKIYALGLYSPVRFNKPHGAPTSSSEFLTDVGAAPPHATVQTDTEEVLATEGLLEKWIKWVLEGGTTNQEEAGSSCPCKAAPYKTHTQIGKSVNSATGNESKTQVDLSVGGRGPGLVLARTYNSQLAASENAPGVLGYGWTDLFMAHTEETGGVRLVYEDDGAAIRFIPAAGGKWEPVSPLVQATLAEEGEIWVYTLPNQTVLRFDSAGHLVSESDRNGNAITLHGPGGKPESVSDGASRSITFKYTPGGQLESATDPLGNTVKFAYEEGNLVSVTEPGEANPNWTFKYDGSHQLTAETDGRSSTTERKYDSSHRVISETDPLKRTRIWEYSSPSFGHEASITTITEPNGSITREEFSFYGTPTVVTHAYGTTLESTTTNEYGPNGTLISSTDPDGHKTIYTYNAAGDRTTETNPANDTTELGYNGQHFVISTTHPSHETTTITRDEHGNAIQVSRPAPNNQKQITNYKYDGEAGRVGDLLSVEDSLKRTTKYEYDSYGDRTSETDPEGDKRTRSYNADSQETATVAPRGHAEGAEQARFTTTIARDPQGRPTVITEPLGEISFASSFTPGGLEGTLNEPDGVAIEPGSGNTWVADSGHDRVLEYGPEHKYIGQFGSQGSGAGQFSGIGGVATNGTYIYVTDSGNSRVEIFNASTREYVSSFGSYGLTPEHFYQPRGIAIDEKGNVWVVNSAGTLLQEFSSDGKHEPGDAAFGTANIYNHPGGLAIVENDLFVSESVAAQVSEYTTAGKSVGVFDSKSVNEGGKYNFVTAIAADPTIHALYVTESGSLPRVQVFTAPHDETHTPTFASNFGSAGSGNGQFSTPAGIAISPSGQIYVIDAGNNRIQQWGNARTTKYAYDPNGNVEHVTDSEGHTTTYTYDADNEPTTVQEPNGTVTETGYDAEGQVKSQTDGNKHTTEYVRNEVGEVTKVIDPRKRTTVKEYDLAGNLIKLTDPEGRATSYTYDAANRLVALKYSDGATPTATYQYDADGNRVTMTDGSGTSKYTYDQLDRLTEAKTEHGTSSYEYDLANEQTKITYPNGKAITRSYDNAGRLKSVADWLGNVTSFSYDGDANLAKATFPTGTSNVDEYTYNSSDEMNAVKMTKGAEVLSTLGYTRDQDGQITATANKGLPGPELTIDEYDANSRLAKDGTNEYRYDAANNATKIGPGTNTYDEADELQKGGSSSYAYNEEGMRTKTTPASGPSTSYGYDQAGNLISVTRSKEGETNAIEDSYTYNGEGLRVAETISGATNFLIWDTTESLPLLLTSGTNSFIYGPNGLPVEQINNGTRAIQYLHHDQQRSTRLVTGETGSVEGKCSYSAFGMPACEGSALMPLGYDGQDTNSDTGLIYLHARNYDPSTAQFVSRDPLTSITWEPYSYVSDNPVNAADPSGLSEELELPCVWPFCGPPPAAVEGAKEFGEGVVNGAEITWREVENGWNSIVEQNCTPSPALEGSPYSPREVDRRRSALRRGLRTGNQSPESAIPDQSPGESFGPGVEPSSSHRTGERNVNPEEEHSRTPKGAPYYGP
jgi:RHS repeat-associated protein